MKHFERICGDNVQAFSAIDESLGDSHVVDGGAVDQREGSNGLGGLEVVMSVKGDGVLRPFEGPGGLEAGEGGVELVSKLLELIVRFWRMCPPEDAGNVASWGLVATVLLVREVAVFLRSIGLVARWLLVAAIASTPR